MPDSVSNVERKDICQVIWSTTKSILFNHLLLIGLVLVVILGATVPSIGHKGGPLKPEITTSWLCVIVIFFNSGLNVKTQELAHAALYWRLNIFVHFFVFVWYPAIGFALVSILKATTTISVAMLNGLLVTTCLPTTISSAVVLTMNCGGNEAAAIINTALTNVIVLKKKKRGIETKTKKNVGIMVTPGLVLLLLGGGSGIDIKEVLFLLMMRVLIPFVIGQLVRSLYCPLCRRKADTYNTCLKWQLQKKNSATTIFHMDKFIGKFKSQSKVLNEVLLLLIVLTAISELFYSGVDASFSDIAITFCLVTILHILTLAIVWFVFPSISLFLFIVACLIYMYTLDAYLTSFYRGISSISQCQKKDNLQDPTAMTSNSQDNKQFWIQTCLFIYLFVSNEWFVHLRTSWSQFTFGDRAAMLFCSSQKTIAFGVPMISTLYQNKTDLGIYLVPLLLFHPMQKKIQNAQIQANILPLKEYSIEMSAPNSDSSQERLQIGKNDGYEKGSKKINGHLFSMHSHHNNVPNN
ncbi:hypothetical protein RFI_29608 [Reticulomyxa filosa]|uniref:Uncharacterized protein n=1 Tax=Reticulomyxa filosa TaxID=46433 RepID=X6M2V1_RETFI|nr:hypothetical protein RFI_29608 [Reticulomyxa filosa]|eukprot:ETO07782.1 hypothetical protein RFI_29608 [Reticulomyxa filosa]